MGQYFDDPKNGAVWVDRERVTENQFNRIVQGLRNFDAALARTRARNWFRTTTLTGIHYPVYDTSSDRWFVSDRTTYDLITYTAATSFPAALTNYRSGASSGAGVVVIGGTPSGSTASKYRRCVPGVYPWNDTWTATNSTSVSTAGVRGIAWHPTASLFVACLDNGVVETSPNGTTWTSRTVPAAVSGWDFAQCVSNQSVSSPLLVITAGITNSRDKCITSSDGVTWTDRTMPASARWTGLAYSATRGIWMAAAEGGNIATSPDGITWTAKTAQAINVRALAEIGGVFAVARADGDGAVIRISEDEGTTWETVATYQTDECYMAAGDGRFYLAGNSSHTYSLRV